MIAVLVQNNRFQVPDEPIYIVTEFMCNGSLLDYLRTGEGKETTFTDHVDMAAQVKKSLNYFTIYEALQHNTFLGSHRDGLSRADELHSPRRASRQHLSREESSL